MNTEKIQFNNGFSYEQYMGKWSQLVGKYFLDWVAPGSGQRWLDVGCGSGAFTEMLIERCNPASVHGIDPSEEQLAYARARPTLGSAQFCRGDAMELPYSDNDFDAAVMPLVIFFVPDPGVGVAEMKRVVRPGGVVTAYAWDMEGGGFPYEVLLAELRELGFAVPTPPSVDASRLDIMRGLWVSAGLDAIETKAITVRRTFTNFDEFWATALEAPSVGSTLAAMAPESLALLKAKARARLKADTAGRITYCARANAIKAEV